MCQPSDKEVFNTQLLFVGYGCEAISIEPVEPGVSNILLRLLQAKRPVRDNHWAVDITPKRATKRVKKDLDKPTGAQIELHKQLHNIREILLYSNATPIKSYSASGFFCNFCMECFIVPADLKQHTLENHDELEKEKFMEGTVMISYVVKLDITGLECFICNSHIDSLQNLIDHLRDEHNKEFYTDINNYILPFKFENDNCLRCVLCPNVYMNFKQIQEHMSVHYPNFVCDICNRPFVNKHTLQGHKKRHEEGEYKCTYCPKVYITKERKFRHERNVHTGDQNRNKCPYCPEKFVSYTKRNDHMVQEHGAKPFEYKCLACEKTFNTKAKLTMHTKRDHLLERRFECAECDKKFFTKRYLKGHMLKHTGEKNYKCDFCSKEFGRIFTLKQHLRIHLDDRKFKCELCGQSFIQKCSLRGHMRSKHGEIL